MNIHKEPEQKDNAELLSDLAETLSKIKEGLAKKMNMPEFPIYEIVIDEAVHKVDVLRGRLYPCAESAAS